jgi:hypothetical protein
MAVVSISCASSVLLALYLLVATWNLYKLMVPLARIDLSLYSPQDFVKPLWPPNTPLYLRVYLSTHRDFTVGVLEDRDSSRLLWEELVHRSSSVSKSLLLTVSPCASTISSEDSDDCQDKSFQAASQWLDDVERHAAVDRGLSVDMEGTSLLLSICRSASRHLQAAMQAILRGGNSSMLARDADQSRLSKPKSSTTDNRTLVQLSPTSPLWSALQNNSTLYTHVVLIHDPAADDDDSIPVETPNKDVKAQLLAASRSHRLLLGNVNLMKWDLPHHVLPPSRVLYHDLTYLIKRYVLWWHHEQQPPPWNMEVSKPQEHAAYIRAQQRKDDKVGCPYWKPLVSIQYISDRAEYPMDLVHSSGMPIVQLERSTSQHPTGLTFLPAIHVDEIGLTSEKYIPINDTVTSLPLRISFDRNDIVEHDDDLSRTASAAGGISPARWRLLSHLAQAIESQAALGFDESDIDDVRRLIADTNGKFRSRLAAYACHVCLAIYLSYS